MEARTNELIQGILRWYNKEDVVPTLETMLKVIAFHHDKNTDMSKLGCTLPHLAKICQQKSTDAKVYPFTEGDKDLLGKIREDVVGGPSIAFTRKAVVDEIFIQKCTNICKNLLLGLMPAIYTATRCVNLCPPIYIRVKISVQKPVDSRLDKKRPVASKIWSCLIFNVEDLIVKLRASTLQADRKK